MVEEPRIRRCLHTRSKNVQTPLPYNAASRSGIAGCEDDKLTCYDTFVVSGYDQYTNNAIDNHITNSLGTETCTTQWGGYCGFMTYSYGSLNLNEPRNCCGPNTCHSTHERRTAFCGPKSA